MPLTVKVISSESVMETENVSNLREYRILKETSQYFNNGAAKYYQITSTSNSLGHTLSEQDYADFVARNSNKTGVLNIISLGCGNGHRDKFIVSELSRQNAGLKYFGVDASIAMVYMTYNTFAGLPVEGCSICADFGSNIFQKELKNLVKRSDNKIYMLIGSTLGNVGQEYMIDVLDELLYKNDLVMFDVVVRQDLSSTEDDKIYQMILDWIIQPEKQKFIFGPLGDMGIDVDDGELFIDMIKEDKIGALRFRYRFKFNRKVSVNYKDTMITFLPDSDIEIFNMRAYDPESLIKFLETRNFMFVDSFVKGNKGLFMFKKN